MMQISNTTTNGNQPSPITRYAGGKGESTMKEFLEKSIQELRNTAANSVGQTAMVPRETLNATADVFASILARMNELEKDSARYRYLTMGFGIYCITNAMENKSGVLKSDGADFAIDTAMQANKGK